MTDILTVTMNPCVDVSTSTAKVAPEHKLRCEAPRREPGGGGINVARVVQRLGGACVALFPVGGTSGAQLLRLLAAEQVPTVPVPIAGDTRESLHVRDRSAAEDYRFVMPGPNVAASEWQACLQHLTSMAVVPRYLVLSGSLPPGVPVDFYAQLVRLMRERGSRLVLDASGPALAAALEAGVYLVKPSLRELRELSGQALESETQWRAAAQQLVDAGRAEVVVLSLGAQGALMVSRQETVFAPALAVPVSTTVGAGDSFVGGMVHALAGGASLRDAFGRGVAAASAALLGSGTGLCQSADVERLHREVVLQVR